MLLTGSSGEGAATA